MFEEEEEAYDEFTTTFSPDGRLLQIEYALEVANHGATILGLTCSEGVVLGAEEGVENKLQDPDFSWKIYEVDDHVGVAVVGLESDARVLIRQARMVAQMNRLTYDEPIDVEILARRIGDIKQLYTQHVDVRPFGVSMIFCGVDKTGNRVFATDPSGSCRAYRAVALGYGREAAEAVLNREYRIGLRFKEAVKLAKKCFAKVIETREEKLAVRMAAISSETKKFRMLTAEEILG